ncbi:response regulator, partial [Klebsiella sp. SWET4]|uniref:ATP-binding response regulator n=1 Tax=Klebsiella sp. SWET4 TaxID=2961620 RepID=UPI0020C8D7AD
LGLAICRELARGMGGEVSLFSRPGQGSAFTVSAPLRKIASAAPIEAAEPPPAPPPLRLLAAEDNPTNQLVLSAVLRQVGVEPVMVDNGAKALEAWRDGQWDVVLMDIHMPVMDGLTALKEIRRLEAERGLRRTPVIALTANAMRHQVDHLLEAGMDDHVAKPIRREALIAAVARALDGRPPAEIAERSAQ